MSDGEDGGCGGVDGSGCDVVWKEEWTVYHGDGFGG